MLLVVAGFNLFVIHAYGLRYSVPIVSCASSAETNFIASIILVIYYVVSVTLLMVATTLLPFASGMAGAFYLGSAIVLDVAFLGFALALWRRYSHALARRTFAYSIFYLAMIFAALMVDHYLPLAFG